MGYVIGSKGSMRKVKKGGVSKATAMQISHFVKSINRKPTNRKK